MNSPMCSAFLIRFSGVAAPANARTTTNDWFSLGGQSVAKGNAIEINGFICKDGTPFFEV